jgi:hypothetical protein
MFLHIDPEPTPDATAAGPAPARSSAPRTLRSLPGYGRRDQYHADARSSGTCATRSAAAVGRGQGMRGVTKVLVLVGVLSLTTVAATAVGASPHSNIDAACQFNGEFQFTPGLTTTAQATTVSLSALSIGGDDSVCPRQSASFTGQLQGDLSCEPGTFTLLGTAKGRVRLNWSDSTTSDVHLKIAAVQTARSGPRVAVRGVVRDGDYAGDKLSGMVFLTASPGDVFCRPGQGMPGLEVLQSKPRTKPLTFVDAT